MQRDQQLRGLRLSFRSGLPLSTFGLVSWITISLIFPARAGAADFDSLFAGTNDFGNVGLMQTPTARMRPDGDFGVGISTVRPYNQIHVFVQPLPWLESTIRYTDITNRFYSSDPSFSGNQHTKDKSADVKVRLLMEGQYWPSVAFGVQDIGGTGLFSSEFLVSSYHWYDFDFSFGLGWGRLGSEGGIYNPFRILSNHFDQDRNTSSAGGVGLNKLFTGQDIGPFGGIEWNTPLKGLSLRLEYDGNDYQHESLNNNQRQASHLNFGFGYRGIHNLDLGVGFERGEVVMARVAIYTNFQSQRGVIKTADPPVVAVPDPALAVPPVSTDAVASAGDADVPADESGSAPAVTADGTPATKGQVARPANPQQQPVNAGPTLEERHAFIVKLKDALAQQGFTLMALDYDGYYRKSITLWVNQDRYRNPAKAIGRASRVVCAAAPDEIAKFTLVFVDSGVENYRAEVRRDEFERTALGKEDFDTGVSSVLLTGPGDGYSTAEYSNSTYLPKFSWDMGPAVRQSVGGPDGFYFGQLYWKVAGSVALTDHLGISAAAGFNIINNFNDIKLQSNSTLPHVRSDIVKYLQQGKNGIINLESDYVWSPYPNLYHRLSFGIFEEMYGGVATELLYRPYGHSWAVAFDINRVRQRGYDELFDFLPYTVTTGHVALYYKPGYYNLLFKLSGGQYLAGDRGGTLDISREFDSGMRVGVFATKTNVSSAQFGEGSFDKGLYISLPLDLFFAQSTRREAGFTFRPLTRDGGQMVYDGPELYFTVKDGQPADFARGASELLK